MAAGSGGFAVEKRMAGHEGNNGSDKALMAMAEHKSPIRSESIPRLIKSKLRNQNPIERSETGVTTMASATISSEIRHDEGRNFRFSAEMRPSLTPLMLLLMRRG